MWRCSDIRQSSGQPEAWKPGRKSPGRPGGHGTIAVGSAQGANNQEGRS